MFSLARDWSRRVIWLYIPRQKSKGAFLWGDPSSDQWSKICLDHSASKEPASVFLWGDPSSDQWSKICLDHGASKEPANPWPEWIRRFLWCTMIQTDLGSLIRTRITPKERTPSQYSSIFKTARVAKNIWRVINTITSIWRCYGAEGEVVSTVLYRDRIIVVLRSHWVLLVYDMVSSSIWN